MSLLSLLVSYFFNYTLVAIDNQARILKELTKKVLQIIKKAIYTVELCKYNFIYSFLGY